MTKKLQRESYMSFPRNVANNTRSLFPGGHRRAASGVARRNVGYFIRTAYRTVIGTCASAIEIARIIQIDTFEDTPTKMVDKLKIKKIFFKI